MTTINLGKVVGENGEDGRGIVSITKTGTSGLVDTYTITYTDNTTSTFEVTNGSSGSGGTSNYNELSNKPSINSVELSGNKTLGDLGAQAELVSGTNIKTINNTSLLGEGNITIQGGGGSSLPVVNVKDFGATGDGSTDDTQAIQNALDSVQSGGTVFFPKGVYMLATALFNPETTGISHAIEVYSNQRLLFEEGATLKRGSAAVNHMLYTHNESGATGYTGAENIEIIGATIDGNKGTYSSSQTPVNLSHSTNVRIINCIFQNVGSGWHSIEINSSLDTVIDGCIFKDSTNTEDVQLDAAVSSGNLGSSDGTVCKDTHIRNCVFDVSSGVAIGNHTNASHTNTRIYNNVFRGTPNTSRGYLNFVTNHQKIDVYDNTFYGGTYGVVIPHATKDSTVFNNRFDGTTTPCSGTGITKYTNFVNGVLETGDIKLESSIAIISNTLTNVTNSNDAWIAKIGTSYTATLSVSQQGYTMGNVTVTMNGVDITSTAYDDQTGVITIASITGDIDIVALAYDDQYASVTNTLTNVVNSNAANFTLKNQSYTGTLTATDAGYVIDSVTITMGGIDITSTAYTSATGEISIASVTGNIEIVAVASEDLTLPTGYTRVKQLKSTGTQYIVTDYVTKPTTDIRINDFNTAANSDVNYQVFIGAATADNASDSYEFRCYQKTARLNYTRGNNKSATTDNAVTSAMLIRLYNTTMTVDGTDWTVSNTVTAGSLPLMFFCRNLASAADRLSNAQMGIIKIYEGDTLIKKYIPAIDDNNEPCYYEKVNGVTLRNAGTGTFDTVALS